MKSKVVSVRPGYKMTPLGEIPEDWKVKRLGDLGTFDKGSGIPKKELSKSGLPCVRYGEIYTTHEYVIKKFVSFIDNTVAVQSKRINKGDILLAGSGETVADIGKAVAFVDDFEAYAGGDIIIFTPQKKLLNSITIAYLLDSHFVKKQKARLGVGGQIVHIYPSAIKTISIPVMPLKEQKAIAKILSTWDKAIDKTRQLIEQKELRKKALMQQLLTGKKRLKGFSGEWKEVRLGEVFSERNEAYTKGLPLLTIGIDGIYLQSESSKRDISNDDKSKYKRICPGDIGYNTMRMWQGRCVLSHLEGIVSPAYTVVTALEGQSSEFYALLFTLPETVYKFYRHSQGLVKDTLNCKFPDFAQIKVHSPGVEEQIAIANLLGITDDDLKIEKERLEKLKLQKKALMQVLLTGKKRLVK
ncbi:MAG: hypothetical protein HBSAPP04_05290 [Ignavibacteriaceae bacterium]|nr:MAG: hypothetical protein HBSAPP04_05290 [Ignavibacteriaceae bacterium]